MPLSPGSSREVISQNVHEMVQSGYPQRQAVAASLSNARRHPSSPHRDSLGGPVNAGGDLGGLQGYDGGGLIGGASGQPQSTPYFIRSAARELYHPGGLINSTTAGRTDRLPISVATNAYVMPADVVSGLGQGNTLAGAHVMEAALKIGPHGVPIPHGGGGRGIPRPPSPYRFATGGDVHRTSILAAGGEYVVNPEHVLRLGGGDMKKGHRLLDAFVKQVRAHVIKEMRHLPGPKK